MELKEFKMENQTNKGVEYRPVKGFERSHLIGSDGTIIATKPIRKAVYPSGSQQLVTLRYNGRCRSANVGRLLMESFNPSPDPDMYKFVIHKDGDITNNSLDNLEWATRGNYNQLPVLNTNTGEIYSSIKEAADKHNIHVYQMRKILNDKNNTLGLKIMRSEEHSNQKGIGTIVNLPGEEWVHIEATQNRYMISNMGRVVCMKSSRSSVPYLSPMNVTNGNLSTCLYVGKGKKNRRYITIKNAVYKHFVGPILGNSKIINIDGDIMNNKVDNLKLVERGRCYRSGSITNELTNNVVGRKSDNCMKIEKVIKIGNDLVNLCSTNKGVELYRATKPQAHQNKFATYLVKDDEVIMKFDTEGWNFIVQNI